MADHPWLELPRVLEAMALTMAVTSLERIKFVRAGV